MTENARAIVTASGSPSGTATTITVIAMIRNVTNCETVSISNNVF
jgi:hypothetical protein